MGNLMCELYNSSSCEAAQAASAPVVPQTMFVGKPYERWGHVEKTGKTMFDMQLQGMENMPDPFTIEAMRGMMEMFDSMLRGPAYDKWAEKVTVKKMSVGGPEFYEGTTERYALLSQNKGTEDMKNRKCMIFFHGGGAVTGSPEGYQPAINRYAAESDVNIISVKYGLAPENPAPKGIQDAYSSTLDIVNNPDRWGCDPKKVGMFGDSGGGYITAGVGMMLGERNESDLIRF